MISIRVGKLRLGAVGFVALFLGANENVGRRQKRHQRQNLIGAVELGRLNQHGCQLRLQRQLGHLSALLSQVEFFIHGTQVVQQLKRAHQRLRRGRVHKVKVHQIVDAQALELQYHGAQVGAQNLVSQV